VSAHGKLTFPMPARADIVFDAFHYHEWKCKWDSLVRDTQVQDGASCPSVGAITENAGAGALRALAMRTRFIQYDRPRLAAAVMVGRSFPFAHWAASMRHEPVGPEQSLLIYTYTFLTGPKPLRWLMGPLVEWMFVRKTRDRFKRLEKFLTFHARDIGAWQQRGHSAPAQPGRPTPVL
jgi:hypothetical protein